MVKGLWIGFSVAAATSRPCDVAPGKDQPWCDVSLSLEQRVSDLVVRIPDGDVPALLTSPRFTGPVSSLNIPSYQWWNEGLHGVGYSPGVNFRGPLSAATSFPQVVTSSMSFNTSLFNALGAAISTEARAFNNQGQAGLTFWTPNINVFRDPRWGRGQETPGEDPLLTTAYAVHFVKGMQEGPEDAKHLKASACLKHYTAYDLESWGHINRHHFDARVSDRDLVETFDPPFEAGVKEGHASCVMCSYNSVNGIPSCANRPTLQERLRDDWGLDGYITSDCGAVLDIFTNHKYTKSLDNTSFLALNAGMDTDCGVELRVNLAHAMKKGIVSRKLVDQALTHLFRTRMRLGEFDPVDTQPFAKFGPEVVNSETHQQLALDAARQGMTLLKNVDGSLPLDKTSIKTLAVIGPSASRTNILKGNYNGKAPFLVSVSEGLKRYAKVKQEVGCWAFPELILDYDPRIERNSACTHALFSPAEAAARHADATVLVLGLDQKQESEGHDRTDLFLPGKQQELAERVAAAAKGPVVLVILAGGAVDVSFAKNSGKFAAILFAGYPGEAGGQAVAETLFGDNNPSGRLTQTFYANSYLSQWKDTSTSYFDMSMRADVGTGNPGRGYRFFQGEAVYLFGTGLSYTSFGYSVPRHVNITEAGAQLKVELQNTGSVPGRHTVLAFVEPPAQAGDGLRKRLVHFQPTGLLAPGAGVKLQLDLKPSDFELVKADGSRSVVEGTWTIRMDDVEILVHVAKALAEIVV